MKNLLFLFAMLFTFNAYADIGLVDRSTALDGAGNLLAGSLEKVFIKVKNTSGGSVANGDVMILDVAEDDGYSVTTTTTAASVPVCVMAQACADDVLCDCQTYGLKDDVNFDSTNYNATAGSLAFVSENFAGAVQAELPANYAVSDVPIGVFYDSPSASGDTELFIKLR